MNTTYLLNQAASRVWGTDKLYLSMSTTPPNLDGTGATEPVVDGNGFSRIELKDLSEPADGVISNTTELFFPLITKPSGRAAYWTIYDSEAVGSGNLLKYQKIEEEIELISRTKVSLEIGGLKLEVKNTAKTV